MALFIYPQKTKLQDFLIFLEGLNDLYRKSDFQFIIKLNELLVTCKTHFKEIGKNRLVAKIDLLHTEYTTVFAGIHPVTLEKVRQDKRSFQKGFSFKILQSLQYLVLEELKELEGKLKEAEGLVGQIILTSLQQGKIDLSDAAQTEISILAKNIWKQVNKDTQLKLLNQKLALQLNVLDIVLIYQEILSRIIRVEKSLYQTPTHSNNKTVTTVAAA